MRETRSIEWAPSALADCRWLLGGAGSAARSLYDQIMQELRGLVRRGQGFGVPPEFMEVGLTHIREARVGAVRILFRVTRSRISIVGVLDARHDPGETLMRHWLQGLI